jgi:hypothetical protein
MGPPAKHLIVRFESSAHWSTGPDAAATVRFNGIVHIADKEAWAKGSFAYPRRGEVWMVIRGERSPWGSTVKIKPLRRLNEAEASVLPKDTNAMEVRVCNGRFCARSEACEIARLLRERHPDIEVEEVDCTTFCMSAPVVMVGETPHGPVNPTEEGVDELVNQLSIA